MTDNFQRLWGLGYHLLLPIVPPGSPISERSTMFKRLGTSQDGRGKIPGVKGRDGNWYGIDLTTCVADETDLVRWQGMQAGTGVRTGLQPDGNYLVAIDADTTNQDFAILIRDEVRARLPDLPTRVGQSPKAMYICRLNGPLPYTRIEFGPNIAGPQDKHPRFERVEVLTDERQFVAEGIHPKTGKPYSWPREIVAYEALPVFAPEQIIALMEELRGKLPAASKVITEGAGTEVSQASLTGSLDAIKAAVSATPNSSNMFPSRESYVQYGLAIKAALPDNEPAAFDLFSEWCARWGEGENDPDVVAADWRRMKPPYRRGASWLYELAEQYGTFDRSTIWHEPVGSEVDLNPFSEVEVREAEQVAAQDVYPLLTLDEIMSRPPPVYMIARHIPQVSMGFLYSVPGAGKTFLALDMALSAAAALENWHGDSISADPEAIVLYIVSEGSFGFRNRVKAWLKARNIENAPKRFLIIEKTINFMKPEDVDRLLRTVRATGRKLCMVVVDTVSRAMPGADENLQKEMTLFVNACDRVKDAFGCAVLGVHHAGKSGDMRGSTVLLGAGDYVFKLEREQGRTIGRLRCEKQKDAPDGWEEPYSFAAIDLGEGESSLVVDRVEDGFGPSTELTPAVGAAVLRAMGDAWDSGEPWSKAAQSKERHYVRRMVSDFGFKAGEAEEMVRVWEGSGLIVTETRDAKRRKSGFKVVGAMPKMEENTGVFD